MKTNYRKLHRNLKYILPLKCEDLIRLGNKNDSGYIVSKRAIKNSNTMISLGMANNWSFENEFLKINQKNCVYIYDHTVDLSYFFLNLFKSIKRFLYFKSSLENISNKFKDLQNYISLKKSNRIHHFQKKISDKNLQIEIRLNEILKEFKNKKVILSIDIEGDEFKLLNDILNFNKNIHMIVIEFHFLNKKKKKFEKIVKKLKEKFNIIHIHGNNYTSFCTDGLPVTLEMTFINKNLYPITKKTLIKKFPIKNLDYPNLNDKEDLKFYY